MKASGDNSSFRQDFQTDRGVSAAERDEQLEQGARVALESRAGHLFADEEWALIRGRLRECFNILRGWEEQAEKQGTNTKASLTRGDREL